MPPDPVEKDVPPSFTSRKDEALRGSIWGLAFRSLLVVSGAIAEEKYPP
ncbi:MAG: hypothetical protein WBA99_11140 [Nodosilinea sp.]